MASEGPLVKLNSGLDPALDQALGPALDQAALDSSCRSNRKKLFYVNKLIASEFAKINLMAVHLLVSSKWTIWTGDHKSSPCETDECEKIR